MFDLNFEQLHRRTSWRLAACCAALWILPAAHADEWYRVRRIEYANKGSYVARASVEWRDSQANQDAESEGTAVLRHGSRSFDASALTSARHILDEGEELWLVVEIDGRNETSCRDAKTRFRFDPDGGVVAYETAGSVLRGHQCKIKRVPGNKYLERP